MADDNIGITAADILAGAGSDIFFRPTKAARATLPPEKADGWWAPRSIIPRNKQDQRIDVDGTSYRVRQTFESHEEYLDGYREGPLWDLDVDPDPMAPAYARDPYLR